MSIFSQSHRRAIFLSEDKLCVYHFYKGRIDNAYLFDVNEEGKKQFERYLDDIGPVTTYVLVDVVEEEYKKDSIPHVYGSDRKSLIKRKKSRLFRDTPYFYVDFLGRQTEGRKDDEVLFIGLTNPEIIQPWVEMLDSKKTPLAGIFTVPQVKKLLLEQLPESGKHTLVVTMQSISGLRQTYFQDKKLIISRLVSLPRYGEGSYASAIKEEIEKTKRYLDNLYLHNEDEVMDIIFIANRELLNELTELYIGVNTLRPRYIDINDLSNKYKLPGHFTTPFSDQVLVQCLLKRKPENLYATESETRYYKLQQIKKVMYATSIIMLLFGMVFGSFNLLSGLSYKQDSIALEKKAAFYQDQYVIAQEKLPETPVSPRELEIIHNIVKTIDTYKSSPVPLLKTISRGLDNYSDIQINEIFWSTSDDPDFEIEGTDQFGKVLEKSRQNVSDKDEEYNFFHIVILKAKLASFKGDYRMALEKIDNFAESLRQLNNIYDVNITSLPLNISSTAQLQGDTGVTGQEADFSVRIVLGFQHET